MDVFLDLDNLDGDKVSDDLVALNLLNKFQPSLTTIGKRVKQIKKIGISYDTASVALYDQAKDLYCLGYFVSSIIVCRSTAEYLAYEIFYEEVELDGKQETLEKVAESIDFRKIVNEFLYNTKNGIKIIDKETHDLFNKLYTLGNNWVHPKKYVKGIKIEDEALKVLEILRKLLTSLRDVMRDYDILNGKLVKKESSRKNVRPIDLTH